MPDIMPNWHPAAVHFPIALVFAATLFFLAGRLRPASATLMASARLLLPLAAVAALIAAALGWHAYLTVEHDAAGHLVMLRHRNWAMASTAGLLLLALQDALRQRAGKPVNVGLLPAMLLLSAGLGVTGWLGGEMVYRHGVGVSPAAFASPEAATAAAAPVEPVPPIPASPTPPDVPGEHIHKDGKRHHH